METCVLIPQEFSLAVTAAGARNSGEQMVSVWTTTRIKQGALYYPFQGTVRIDKLNIYSYISEEDVSTYSIFIIFILGRTWHNMFKKKLLIALIFLLLNHTTI